MGDGRGWREWEVVREELLPNPRVLVESLSKKKKIRAISQSTVKRLSKYNRIYTLMSHLLFSRRSHFAYDSTSTLRTCVRRLRCEKRRCDHSLFLFACLPCAPADVSGKRSRTKKPKPRRTRLWACPGCYVRWLRSVVLAYQIFRMATDFIGERSLSDVEVNVYAC